MKENAADKKSQDEPLTKRDEDEALPPADFSTLILSLSTSALMHLGEIKNPDSGNIEKNMAVARHTIDIISILKEKTKGNLTDEEEQLINGILHDLRIHYLKAAEKKET